MTGPLHPNATVMPTSFHIFMFTPKSPSLCLRENANRIWIQRRKVKKGICVVVDSAEAPT